MLRVPRTKYFIDLWPGKWEKNAKREGGGGEVPVHAAILPGDGVAVHETSELSLLCSQDVLSAFWEDMKLMDLSWTVPSPECLLRCEWAWQWTVLADPDCKCAPTVIHPHNPTQEWEWVWGWVWGWGSNRLTGMLPAQWSCLLAEKMWVMEWLGEHGLFC